MYNMPAATPSIQFLSTSSLQLYLGLFNSDNQGNSSNHIFAVELDTIQNPEFGDINDNHVGIDINSLNSSESWVAGYYEDGTSQFKSLSLVNKSEQMQVWVDFNGEDLRLTITLSPTEHYISGRSFAKMPDAELPNHVEGALPPVTKAKGGPNILPIWMPLASCLVASMAAATVFVVWRRKKYAELLEDWELEYGPHRFTYKDLFQATAGFKEKELLGTGGFGRVYRGLLPTSKVEVAVKVSHESRQGMKEFVSEIVSIGLLRHRNLVQLLGYCRRKGELLLVYDFMPNGSLDRFLYGKTEVNLSWDQRFRIIKGVASGLLYLHEEWEQVVVHRDIKASNVLLDEEFNGRLGDFGLAKLCDRGTDPQTTHLVGTMGYIAPELTRTGKATTATDVFAFGAFCLEVACGRRPIMPRAHEEELVLVDWVLANWQKGLVLETRDQRLGEEYCADEIELVLKLGLLCSHPIPSARPNIRQVLQFLEGDLAIPELSPSYLNFSTLLLFQNDEFNGCMKSLPLTVGSISGLSGGR